MRWRLVASFCGVMVVVLLAVGVPLARHLRAVEADRMISEMQRDAFVLGGTAQDAIVEGPSGTARLQASLGVYAAESGSDVVVTDDAGVVVAASPGAATIGADLAGVPGVADALVGSPAAARAARVSVAVPLRDGAVIVGAIRVVAPEGRVADRARGKVRGLVAVGAISLSAAVIAALFVAGNVVRPLRRLHRSTERVASGEFSAPALPPEGPPEVRDLAAAFAAMTARVAALVEQQRAFAGDASHQLRTPLTALRLQLERAADLVEHDPRAARERLDAAVAETERLQRTVDGLLVLARSARPAPTVVVDVSAIAHERAEVWRPLAGERGVEVAVEAAAGIAARAAADTVEQILDNLLDNALDAAPPGTAVTLAVAAAGEWTEVHVLDRGPGMTDEEIHHAFDRFWRARGAPQDGSGLGLAIVRHLAGASSGEVGLATRVGGGIDACLRLRGAPASKS